MNPANHGLLNEPCLCKLWFRTACEDNRTGRHILKEVGPDWNLLLISLRKKRYSDQERGVSAGNQREADLIRKSYCLKGYPLVMVSHKLQECAIM